MSNRQNTPVRRLLAWILSLMMVFQMLPASVLAEAAQNAAPSPTPPRRSRR